MATKTKTQQPVVARAETEDFTDQLIEPFTQLKSEVDRLFASFPFRLPALKLGRFAAIPALEMTETKKAYKIMAEVPGIDPDQVEVTVEDGMLRIAGEKKEDREESERGYRLSERSYGSFERLVQLPPAADPNKIDAKFKNGVLTVMIEKNSRAELGARKIKIKAA